MIKKQYSTNNVTRWTNSKEYIIVHHTWTDRFTLNWVIRTLTTWRVSCHYVIDTNWDIYKIWKDDDILRHCWRSERNGKKDMNRYSIGIEVIWPLSLKQEFTTEQHKSVNNLVIDLMKKYSIPSSNVLRHAHIAPWRKRDISPSFEEVYWGRKKYQNFLDNSNKMTEEQKKMLIISLMNLNSTLYNEIDDKEIKELMSKINSRFRDLWFDNK